MGHMGQILTHGLCPGSSFSGEVIMGDQGCVPGAATTSTTAEPGACLEYDVQSQVVLEKVPSEVS